MRIRYTLVRILAGLIDLIVVYVPTLIVLNLWFHSGFRGMDLLAQLVFLVYNIIALSGFHGKTLGKYFAHLQVDTSRLVSSNPLFLGIREVSKLLYFTPVIGIPLLIISMVVCLFTGKMLEDYIGQTSVIVAMKSEAQSENK